METASRETGQPGLGVAGLQSPMMNWTPILETPLNHPWPSPLYEVRSTSNGGDDEEHDRAASAGVASFDAAGSRPRQPQQLMIQDRQLSAAAYET